MMENAATFAPEHAGSRDRIGRLTYRVIALCALFLLFDGFDVGAIGYLLPALARSWARSPSDLTPAIVLGGVGMLIGSMIAGPLGDVRGRKPVFLACIAAFGIFSIASAFSASPVPLAAWRLLTGLGLGGGIPTAIALTSDYVPRKNRPIVVGMMTCTVPVGLLLSGLASSWLVPTYGWRSVFLVGGVLPLLLLPLLVWLLPESLQISAGALGPRPRWRDLVGRLFKDGYATRSLLLWIMFFCNFLATWLVIFWLPTILSLAGSSDGEAALLGSLLPLGGLAGVIGIALIVRRVGTELALASALVLGAAAVIVMWALQLPPLESAIAIALIGIGLQGAQFGMNGLCGAVYPARIRATGSGWSFGVGRMGNILGPGLGGAILAMSSSPRTMLLVAGTAALVAAAAMLLLDRNSGADVFVAFVAPKAAAQTIKKVAELGWKPAFFLSTAASSVGSVLKPAGFVNAKGIISSAYLKDPTDPTWKDDPATKGWLAFMDKYFADGDKANSNNVYGYVVAQTMVQVLKQCGDDLTRENVMRQAANLKDFASDMMLPGVRVNTSPTDFYPIEQMQLMQFEGQSWKLFGDVVDAHGSTR
jgi:MFS family permease